MPVGRGWHGETADEWGCAVPTHPRPVVRGPLSHPLSYVRAARGWTYQDVVDVIAERIGNAAARREKAWRWEHREVVPDRDSQLALAAVLDVPVDRVDREPWPLWLPDGDPVRSRFPWDSGGSVQSLRDAAGHAVADRRGFGKIPGPALLRLAADWLDLEPAEVRTVVAGGAAGADFVRRVEEGLPRLRGLEATRGGDRVRRILDAELGLVVDTLTRSSYPSALGRRLHGLAAELARIAGWASFDAGLHAAAQRYWLAALHGAHAAGDRPVGANVLKSMSLQCGELGRPAEALALAQAARGSAGPGTPRMAAMLALREARAHAVLGDAASCDRLLGWAEARFGRAGTGDDDPAWLGYFDEGEFDAQVGICHLVLHRPGPADEALGRAVSTLPAAKVRDRVTYLARRAAARLDLGDVDAACELLDAAVPLARQAPSHRNLTRIAEVRAALPPDAGPLRDLDERLTQLSA